MSFLGRLVVNALVVVACSYLLSGIHFDGGIWSLIGISILIAFLNAIVRPILIILTIPVTIVTLGLFLLVINASIILLADKIASHFSVDNFWWALAFSLILSIVSSFFSRQEKKHGKGEF
ncbi:MAG: phage holin family protein [Flavobacteriales bacterium]|nr:phage holin family protein [Flavobacteriales bacterium]